MFGRLVSNYLSVNKLTTVYLIGSVLLPAVTFYFFWSTLYVLLIYITTKSWQKTVIYCFWPLSTYLVGQLYVFQVIGPMELSHPLYPDGRSIYYKFTPMVPFGVAIVFSWIFWLRKSKLDRYWIILFSLLLVLVNTYSNSINGGVFFDWVIATKSLSQLSIVVWLWWAYNYLFKSSNFDVREYWKYWENFIKTIICIGSVIVILQFIKKSTLGLIVEQTQTIPFFGAGSDEVSWWIRPVGWYGHANGMAMQILNLLLSWFLLQSKQGRKIFSEWLILPVLSIFLLQSRTTLLGFGLLCWWWWYYEGQSLYRKYEWRMWNFWQKIISIFLVSVFSIIVTNRGWATLLSTGKTSGWETRGYMSKMAWLMSKENYWWGIGVENYMSKAVTFDLNTYKMFPEPVHNGFLLILVEQGMLGLLLSVGLIVLIYGSRLAMNKSNLSLQRLLFICLLVQVVNMLFQPTTEILSICSVIVILLFDDKKVGSGV